MNENLQNNLYFFLLLWLLFVCTYEALAAYSIDDIVSIIQRFDNAIWDSLVYLFSIGVENDPFLLVLSKIAFFFPLIFLFVVPYFLGRKKEGESYFYHYNIHRESYYLLVDVITLVVYAILIILAFLFSFGVLTSLPLFLFVIAFRVYQYRKKLIFKE
ncbi:MULTISPECIES: hypothetical protein [unclassified Capnocytophaga]|uniref:hypothetical protein n=1 Tax=unclassified Capnocytophaga TaxID=2640652 RepID=UPI000202E923|nr:MULTISPECIES: hypothetical protein [unclassified Capnocytophaga]EGD33746.1 hypothetical protein HMPREF9071_1687 [Capnocytophaga sp. oral taxon 338 str. F0234]MEB3005459.1 hypothetical protein [Capnocytophaga sp. G2]